jgi:DUF971 family protein
MADPLYLVEVRRLPERHQLRLSWSDGHVAEYDYGYLRGYCPCAVCQGHTATEVVYHPPETAVEVTKIEPVGNYGIAIAFSDGHGTGIYRFEFLRQIDPQPPVASA